MKNTLLVIVMLCTTIAYNQEKIFEKEVLKISKRIDEITKQQKDSLKQKVINIDNKLKNKEITKSNADNLKKEAATYHAFIIEELVGEQEQLLQILVQDKTNGKIASSEDLDNNLGENIFTIGNKTFKLSIDDNNDFEKENQNEIREEKTYKQRRTTTQFVFAMGINNVLLDHNLSSLNNSDYEIWCSRFYELGWTWKTRLSEKPSKLYFKYGISFLWNNLRLEGNRFHEKNEDITEIQVFPDPLSESRLRHVQMNFPMHLEWDFSKNKTYKSGRVKDRTNKYFRVGLGGFFGFKLGTRQYLEYENNKGIDVKEVQYDNFNMNIFNYGVSSFVGYRSLSFYTKYDLNSLFKNTEKRNISIGLRLDLD